MLPTALKRTVVFASVQLIERPLGRVTTGADRSRFVKQVLQEILDGFEADHGGRNDVEIGGNRSLNRHLG
jgi:hypothetical protein